MDKKTIIGGQSPNAKRATDAETLANNIAHDLTMTQRRIRTFYDAVSEVYFPDGAPSWAPDWYEWLLTGEVVARVEVDQEAAENAAIDASAETPGGAV